MGPELRPGPASHDNCVRLLAHLFARFCIIEDVPPGSRGEVLPAFFFGWLRTYMPALAQPESLVRELGLPSETWAETWALVEGGVAPERTWAVWPRICLAQAPPLGRPIESVSLALIVRHQDGRTALLAEHVHQDQLGPGGPRIDVPLTAAWVRQAFRKIDDRLLAHGGLDSLYAQGVDCGTEQDQEHLLGALRLRIAANNEPPAVLNPLDGLARLFQALLRSRYPQRAIDQLFEQTRESCRRRSMPRPMRTAEDEAQQHQAQRAGLTGRGAREALEGGFDRDLLD